MTEQERSQEHRTAQELTPDERARIEEVRKAVNLSDPDAAHQFGSAVQGQLTEFRQGSGRSPGPATLPMTEKIEDFVEKAKMPEKDKMQASKTYLQS